MLGKLFGNSQQGTDEEKSSLLEDWNSYAKTGDVETGRSSSAANDAVAKVGNFLSNSIQTVSAAASSAASSVATLPASLPSAETFRCVCVCVRRWRFPSLHGNDTFPLL